VTSDENGELHAEQVAAYVAKYSRKSSHEQITSRDCDPDRWRDRGVPEQLVQMAALRLSERLACESLGGAHAAQAAESVAQRVTTIGVAR
jgi:hypothetical protein